MALMPGTVGGILKICPKCFYRAWRGIVEIGSDCMHSFLCLFGVVIRIEDPRKKAQLFTVESVEGIKFAFSPMCRCCKSG